MMPTFAVGMCSGSVCRCSLCGSDVRKNQPRNEDQDSDDICLQTLWVGMCLFVHSVVHTAKPALRTVPMVLRAGFMRKTVLPAHIPFVNVVVIEYCL